MPTNPLPPLNPLLYHAHHLLRADDVPFWQTLAHTSPGPLLELGCGTGRILLPLLETHQTLAGLDSDPHMLAYFRTQLPPQGPPNLTLHQGDMRAFTLPQRFDLILLPCNTFSTFPAPEREQIAQTVARHLNPGGLFAVSFPNPEMLASLESFSPFDLEDTFPHPETGHPVEVFSQWKKSSEPSADGETDLLTFTWRYDHRYPNGNTLSQLTTTHHYLDAPEMYLDNLHQAGLMPLHLYGDYASTPFDPDESTYLIVVAQKQSG